MGNGISQLAKLASNQIDLQSAAEVAKRKEALGMQTNMVEATQAIAELRAQRAQEGKNQAATQGREKAQSARGMFPEGASINPQAPGAQAPLSGAQSAEGLSSIADIGGRSGAGDALGKGDMIGQFAEGAGLEGVSSFFGGDDEGPVSPLGELANKAGGAFSPDVSTDTQEVSHREVMRSWGGGGLGQALNVAANFGLISDRATLKSVRSKGPKEQAAEASMAKMANLKVARAGLNLMIGPQTTIPQYFGIENTAKITELSLKADWEGVSEFIVKEGDKLPGVELERYTRDLAALQVSNARLKQTNLVAESGNLVLDRASKLAGLATSQQSWLKNAKESERNESRVFVRTGGNAGVDTPGGIAEAIAKDAGLSAKDDRPQSVALYNAVPMHFGDKYNMIMVGDEGRLPTDASRGVPVFGPDSFTEKHANISGHRAPSIDPQNPEPGVRAWADSIRQDREFLAETMGIGSQTYAMPAGIDNEGNIELLPQYLGMPLDLMIQQGHVVGAVLSSNFNTDAVTDPRQKTTMNKYLAMSAESDDSLTYGAYEQVDREGTQMRDPGGRLITPNNQIGAHDQYRDPRGADHNYRPYMIPINAGFDPFELFDGQSADASYLDKNMTDVEFVELMFNRGDRSSAEKGLLRLNEMKQKEIEEVPRAGGKGPALVAGLKRRDVLNQAQSISRIGVLEDEFKRRLGEKFTAEMLKEKSVTKDSAQIRRSRLDELMEKIGNPERLNVSERLGLRTGR